MSDMQNATQTAGAVPLAHRGIAWTVERHELALFAVATLAVWAHTIDEMRIGEFIAVPFGVANAALVGAWPRLTYGWRAVSAILFGLFWALAVIPYHVAPLLTGSVTGQNISGLSRIVGGTAMVTIGIAILRRREATVRGRSQL